jgi:hypothetical protein
VGPDENETESYVTKVDTTNVGPRRHTRRPREDDDDESRSELKPFFRTGMLLINKSLLNFFFTSLNIE